ncbi:hypothetical protein [Pseudomonas frederiksbergensis]|uniref:Transmembrane protein n=1 Tax=Pseudomonas frederiksbergensis TaxID=104087 RepID=A0A423KSN9_9PSED|nr:hypothetical protein [Pseudomonas frederiksbergensis]RON58714.1 hypothetical protein BK665_01910 [Pseudomonas frederiksbergensis]
MSQKKTRIPLPHPPPPTGHTEWLLIFVSVMVIVAACLLGYMVIEGLIEGRISNMSRGASYDVYSFAQRPRHYWFTIIGHTFWVFVLTAMGVGTIWLVRKINAAPEKPRRRK